MNIYCARSMSGGRRYEAFFQEIIDALRSVPDCRPHFELSSDSQAMTDADIYGRDVRWMQQCQAVIAEISLPSLGVGYEICYALHVLEIPILALVNVEVRRPSSMIMGIDSPLFSVQCYDSHYEVKKAVLEFLPLISNSS